MEIDKLKLLAGDPIEFYGICNIHPFTIRDIKDIGGEKQFNKYLSAICLNKEMIKYNEQDNYFENITNLELIYILSMSNVNFKNIYINAMKFILKDNVILTKSGIFVGNVKEKRFIDVFKYDELTEVIKIQNCLKKQDNEEEYNPGSEKAKQLLEKRKKLREKINRIKNKDNSSSSEPLTLDDLVSILCANGNGINIFNVWDLSFYAFNDQFNRMKMLEDYQVNVRSLLAGADPDKIELKHWMSKID